MTPAEEALRAQFCRWGASLFMRGLSPGSSGNFSARLPDSDGFLVTPTNVCLGYLVPERLSRLDAKGQHVDGDPPTKEVPLHIAVYEARPAANAVVHLHSTYATALSCLADVDPENTVAPITPYVVMRVGKVPLLRYTRPGSSEVRSLILEKAPNHAALLLANHGPVVSASSFEAAYLQPKSSKKPQSSFLSHKARRYVS